MSERIICNDNGGELREEIVRCRDCICLSDDQRRCARFALPLFEEDGGWTEVGIEVEPDGFCAWGERREA